MYRWFPKVEAELRLQELPCIFIYFLLVLHNLLPFLQQSYLAVLAVPM